MIQCLRIISATTLYLLPHTAQAYDKDCKKFVVAENYISALVPCKIAAENDDKGALFNLGYMFDKGLGVDIDRVKAFHLYLRAAQLGDAVAQSNVAYHYEHGASVSQDYEQAYHWYKPSSYARKLVMA